MNTKHQNYLFDSIVCSYMEITSNDPCIQRMNTEHQNYINDLLDSAVQYDGKKQVRMPEQSIDIILFH